MISLRPYQAEAKRLLLDGFKKGHKRQVLCAPTGAGKTVVFSDMIHGAYSKGTQILVLTDRIELFSQTLKAIGNHNIIPQIVKAESKTFFPSAPVTLGMVETIKRRMEKPEFKEYNPKLIILDEAHKGNFVGIIEKFPNAFIVGCTATPIGKHFHKYYTNIVNNINISELVRQGYLAPIKAFQMQDNFDDVKIKGGDYDEKQLFAHYDKKVLYSGVVEKYREKIMGKKTLVFNVNIEHCKKMNDAFVAAGIRSECLTSKTPKEERKKILSDFISGKFPVLCNCGILTTGFDDPKIEAIIMNRATQSLILFMQCLGRGSRPSPGKNHFTVIDFGMNFYRHDLWDAERKWSLQEPKKKRQGTAPIKNCPGCQAMLAASMRICPHCGHKFPEKAIEKRNGVLVEITSNVPVAIAGKKISQLTIDEIIMLHRVAKYKKTYIWRIVRSKGKDALVEYAKKVGYKNGWVFNQITKLQDATYKDYVIK